jgi:hypothetical protein
MNKYFLYNRDNAKLWFEKVDGDNYILNTDPNHKYVLEFARIIYDVVPEDAEIFDFCWNNEKGICRAYDPSGGPYINLGFEVEDKKVVRIYNKEDKTIFVIK